MEQMMVQQQVTMNRVFIHLGPREYGNELMGQVAREAFADYPTADIVEVYEHGGWWLSYRRDGRVVNTANDRAILDEDIMQWWKQWSRVDRYVNLAELWRQ